MESFKAMYLCNMEKETSTEIKWVSGTVSEWVSG